MNKANRKVPFFKRRAVYPIWKIKAEVIEENMRSGFKAYAMLLLVYSVFDRIPNKPHPLQGIPDI